MGRVYVERQFSVAASQIWSTLADYGNVHKFHPNVSNSFILEGSAESGIGARRCCELSDGKNHILERVTDWQEEQYYIVDIYEGSMPLRVAKAKVGVKAISKFQSIAFMEMDYIPKFGILGQFMDLIFMQRSMNKIGKRMLGGLSSFVTSSSVQSMI